MSSFIHIKTKKSDKHKLLNEGLNLCVISVFNYLFIYLLDLEHIFWWSLYNIAHGIFLDIYWHCIQ